jgi:hypothetical protein
VRDARCESASASASGKTRRRGRGVGARVCMCVITEEKDDTRRSSARTVDRGGNAYQTGGLSMV